MPALPLPPDEQERLAALHRYSLLDTPPEAAFDRIAALAARLLESPLALISLVDRDRLWCKSRQGTLRADVPLEISREIGFCTHAILSQDVMVVEDARLDPRFADNPFVTKKMGVRFYAGAPLTLPEGIVLGTLCVMDFAPRSFPQEQQAILKDLAAAVVSEIELRRALSASAENERLYRQMFADNPHPMWVYDDQTWQFLAVNDTAVSLFGYSPTDFLSLTLFDIHLQTQPLERIFDGLFQCLKKDGSVLWMEISSHPVDFKGYNARLAVAVDVTERCRTEDALRQSEQKLARHIQQTPLAVIELEPDMTVTSWNSGAEATFGYTAADAIGCNIVHLIVPPEEQAHVEHLRVGILSRTGGTRSTNYNRTKSGKIILCEWHNTPLADDAGRIIGAASLARDITEEAGAQERLRRSEAHKAAILDSALDCIITMDQQGRIVDWNPAAERTFGWARAEAAGNLITDLILPPPLRASYRKGLLQYLQSGQWPAFYSRVEVIVQRRDGAQFHAELTATALMADTQTLYTLFLRDITERKTMEAEREELLAQTESLLAEALQRADFDPLTGLLNHRAFHKCLKEEIDPARHAGRSGAMLLVDLDNFKFFNDAYGHLAGDEVLRQVAQAFSTVCRGQDTLARYGGDEFALLLPGATLADAKCIACDLRDAISLVSYQPPGYESAIPFSLSVGIACFPDDADTRTSLLEAADAQLRISKFGGEDDSHALHLRRTLARSVGGFSMLDALVTAVDNKDRYTRRHSEDVMHYSLQIAQALHLPAEKMDVIETAALLHDVGKIGVPDEILRKPGRLTEEEFEAIKQHPMMGAVIVGAVAGFEETLDAVRHHHERWDGEGYPFGLRGEETPLLARLMAVADAYSAMTTDRPYRKGMDPEKALLILEEGAGTQWDPRCVQAFLSACHGRNKSCKAA